MIDVDAMDATIHGGGHVAHIVSHGGKQEG
jgi:hypothetical protein